MKLLTKNEVKETKRVQLAQDINQAVKIADHLDKQRQDLNKFKTLKASELKGINSAFLTYSAQVASKRAVLQQEVDSLEKRKKEALKPVTALREQAKTELMEAEVVKEALHSKIEDTLIEKTKYQKSQAKVEKDQKALTQAEKTQKIQEEDLKKRQGEHKTQIESFTKKQEKEEALYLKRSQDLSTNLKVVNQKEQSLNVLREELDKDRDRVNTQERILQDKYLQLAKSQKEILGKKK